MNVEELLVRYVSIAGAYVEELLVRYVSTSAGYVAAKPALGDHDGHSFELESLSFELNALSFEETTFPEFPFLLLAHPDVCSRRNRHTIFRSPRPAQSDRFTFVTSHDMPSTT